MLATFCLRVALGLAAALVLLSPADVAPRFYRVQFLVILGLLAGAAFFCWPTSGPLLLLFLGAAMLGSFLGSIVWQLEASPGGRTCIALTLLTLAVAVPVRHGLLTARFAHAEVWSTLDDWTSAALLGSATSAMLMGHSYLVAPGMSIRPLLRLLLGLFASLLVRGMMAGMQLAWSEPGRLSGASDLVFWLPVRWGLGFLGPLVLGWMAWQCARMRSTQSATGILYVVVVLCFIGELTGQLADVKPASASVSRPQVVE